MAKKKVAKKKKKLTKAELETQLIENFVKMQKVQANLAVKFDELSKNISKLLELFEIAARSFVQKQEGVGGDKDLLNKLDTLIDQNKTIAHGLTLMEGKIQHRMHEESEKPEPELHGLYPKNRPRPGHYHGF